MRREALAGLASVLIASLGFESAKAADRLNIIYPFISGIVLGLSITKKANCLSGNSKRCGFYRQLRGKFSS